MSGRIPKFCSRLPGTAFSLRIQLKRQHRADSSFLFFRLETSAAAGALGLHCIIHDVRMTLSTPLLMLEGEECGCTV